MEQNLSSIPIPNTFPPQQEGAQQSNTSDIQPTPHSKLPFILIGIVLVLLIGTGSIFAAKYFLSPKTTNLLQRRSSVLENKPEDMVTSFLQAEQSKDKTKAKTFLSPNVNKANFQSTFEDTSSSPSLYNQEFTYKITQTKIDLSGNKAFVNVDIVVAGQTLPTKMTLEKNASNMWLITDSETVVYTNTNLPFKQQPRQFQRPNQVLLLLNGPAEFYITSPEGTHTGYDPNTKTQVNEIKDTAYYSPTESYLTSSEGARFRIRSGEPKLLAIADLIGIWELKVIGTGSGKYSIATPLFNSKEPQTSVAIIEGNATLGSVDTYMIRYPLQTEKPLEVTPVK